MDLEHYYTKGAKVINNYQELRNVLWSDSGRGYVTEWERATICKQPRDEYGRFTNNYCDIGTVVIETENGDIKEVDIDDLEPNILPCDLSDDEIEQLWADICRGSLYTADYKNSVGVFRQEAQDCYEGFYDELMYLYGEEKADEYDTPEEFAKYVRSIEW